MADLLGAPGRALADLSLGRSTNPQSPGAPTAGPEVHSSPRHETSADEVSNRDRTRADTTGDVERIYPSPVEVMGDRAGSPRKAARALVAVRHLTRNCTRKTRRASRSGSTLVRASVRYVKALCRQRPTGQSQPRAECRQLARRSTGPPAVGHSSVASRRETSRTARPGRHRHT
jgi:hypothetical protein